MSPICFEAKLYHDHL